MGKDSSNGCTGIDVRPSDDLTTVRMFGEHDISSAPDIEQTLRELLLSGTDILVDLSGLTFADSSVLRVLVQESETALENGCALVVLIPEVPASAAVRRVIQLTQLEQALSIFSNRERAIEHAQRTR
jgi:anti-anti-sigma factor